jgi:hypothetical protein
MRKKYKVFQEQLIGFKQRRNMRVPGGCNNNKRNLKKNCNLDADS